MKGDFTRGHRPDARRGGRYRRVLLQQGRLWLDSDVAASVDATDRLLRQLAVDVGARAASPDLGYLVTPGPLVAVFHGYEALSPPAEKGVPEQFHAHCDYGVKFLGRFASLHVDGRAAPGRVTVKARTPLRTGSFPTLRLWAKVPAGVKLGCWLAGNALALQDTGRSIGPFRAYDASVAGVEQLTTFDLGFEGSYGYGYGSPYGPGATASANEAWVGLVEGVPAAGAAPAFWVASGRYYVDGLEVSIGTGRENVSVPLAAGAAGQRVLVYLEAGERLVTHVERPELREIALGGVDTSVRTEAVGQVKVATLDVPPAWEGALLAPRILEAFQTVDRGAARVRFEPDTAALAPDPCGTGTATGYRGDNRLYRVEVHVAGSLGAAVLKWSRNNGAELFRVTQVDSAAGGLVTVQAPAGGAALQDGDVVELGSEALDLQDATPARVDLANVRWYPAGRATAQALYLVRTSDTSGRVTLLDRGSGKAADLTAAIAQAGEAGLKLRRWDDVIETKAGPENVVVLGDGLRVRVAGSDFQVGDYWQYEARTREASPQVGDGSPDGPERLFAPLAVLTAQGSGTPATLERWLDRRFDSISELDADGVGYDGSGSGLGSWTVQEAIDLLARRGASSALEPVRQVFTKDATGAYNTPLPRAGEIPVELLADGLRLEAGQDVTLANATEAECSISLDLPFPWAQSDVELWASADVGTQPLRLAGVVEATQGRNLVWRPLPRAVDFLRNKLPNALGRPSLETFSSGSPSEHVWSVGDRGQLRSSLTATPLREGRRDAGAAAIYRRPAIGETLMLHGSVPDSVPIGRANEAQLGLVYDWRGPDDFSAVVYGTWKDPDEGKLLVILRGLGPRPDQVLSALRGLQLTEEEIQNAMQLGPWPLRTAANAVVVEELKRRFDPAGAELEVSEQACSLSFNSLGKRPPAVIELLVKFGLTEEQARRAVETGGFTAALGTAPAKLYELSRMLRGVEADATMSLWRGDQPLQYRRLFRVDVASGWATLTPGRLVRLGHPTDIALTVGPTGFTFGDMSSVAARVVVPRGASPGKRFGVFATAPVSVWELTDGVQTLCPANPRVRARLRLERNAARWTGGAARIAPFVPDFEMSFSLAVGPPNPYGKSWTKPDVPYGLHVEAPGIGTELL
jgi:hypothetical protein